MHDCHQDARGPAVLQLVLDHISLLAAMVKQNDTHTSVELQGLNQRIDTVVDALNDLHKSCVHAKALVNQLQDGALGLPHAPVLVPLPVRSPPRYCSTHPLPSGGQQHVNEWCLQGELEQHGLAQHSAPPQGAELVLLGCPTGGHTPLLSPSFPCRLVIFSSPPLK